MPELSSYLQKLQNETELKQRQIFCPGEEVLRKSLSFHKLPCTTQKVIAHIYCSSVEYAVFPSLVLTSSDAALSADHFSIGGMTVAH